MKKLPALGGIPSSSPTFDRSLPALKPKLTTLSNNNDTNSATTFKSKLTSLDKYDDEEQPGEKDKHSKVAEKEIKSSSTFKVKNLEIENDLLTNEQNNNNVKSSQPNSSSTATSSHHTEPHKHRHKHDHDAYDVNRFSSSLSGNDSINSQTVKGELSPTEDEIEFSESVKPKLPQKKKKTQKQQIEESQTEFSLSKDKSPGLEPIQSTSKQYQPGSSFSSSTKPAKTKDATAAFDFSDEEDDYFTDKPKQKKLDEKQTEVKKLSESNSNKELKKATLIFGEDDDEEEKQEKTIAKSTEERETKSEKPGKKVTDLQPITKTKTERQSISASLELVDSDDESVPATQSVKPISSQPSADVTKRLSRRNSSRSQLSSEPSSKLKSAASFDVVDNSNDENVPEEKKKELSKLKSDMGLESDESEPEEGKPRKQKPLAPISSIKPKLQPVGNLPSLSSSTKPISSTPLPATRLSSHNSNSGIRPEGFPLPTTELPSLASRSRPTSASANSRNKKPISRRESNEEKEGEKKKQQEEKLKPATDYNIHAEAAKTPIDEAAKHDFPASSPSSSASSQPAQSPSSTVPASSSSEPRRPSVKTSSNSLPAFSPQSLLAPTPWTADSRTVVSPKSSSSSSSDDSLDLGDNNNTQPKPSPTASTTILIEQAAQMKSQQQSREVSTSAVSTVSSSTSVRSDISRNSKPHALPVAPTFRPPTTTETIVTVWTGTWNLHAKPFPANLTDFIPPYEYDIYCIATQECEQSIEASLIFSSKAKWTKRVTELLGDEYVEVGQETLQAIHIIVFIRRALAGMLSDMDHAKVATGFGDVVGNKGGVGVCFNLGSTSFLFIAAHFAAHQHKVEQRNADFHKINSKLSLRPNPQIPMVCDRFDRVFWMGDLNYRLIGNRSMVDALIKKNMLEVMLSNDQLTIEREKGKVFQGFCEGKHRVAFLLICLSLLYTVFLSAVLCLFSGLITFPPTYKFDSGSDLYDTSKKCRIPSYTDRILYKSTNTVSLLDYSSITTIRTSDHRPVYAGFKVIVQLEKKDQADGAQSKVCTLM